MITLNLLLVILGLIFIAFAAFGLPNWRTVNWGWLGVLLIGIELLVHAALAVRSLPNFYRGDA